jgi:hypothetical protein
MNFLITVQHQFPGCYIVAGEGVKEKKINILQILDIFFRSFYRKSLSRVTPGGIKLIAINQVTIKIFFDFQTAD